MATPSKLTTCITASFKHIRRWRCTHTVALGFEPEGALALPARSEAAGTFCTCSPDQSSEPQGYVLGPTSESREALASDDSEGRASASPCPSVAGLRAAAERESCDHCSRSWTIPGAWLS